MPRDREAAFLAHARTWLEVADLGNNRGLVLDLLALAEEAIEERDRVVRASVAGAEIALKRIARLETMLRYFGIEPRPSLTVLTVYQSAAVQS